MLEGESGGLTSPVADRARIRRRALSAPGQSAGTCAVRIASVRLAIAITPDAAADHDELPNPHPKSQSEDEADIESRE